jgi:serine/threonine-protein kinase RIO1
MKVLKKSTFQMLQGCIRQFKCYKVVSGNLNVTRLYQVSPYKTQFIEGHRDHNHMVVGFTSTCAIIAY